MFLSVLRTSYRQHCPIPGAFIAVFVSIPLCLLPRFCEVVWLTMAVFAADTARAVASSPVPSAIPDHDSASSDGNLLRIS